MSAEKGVECVRKCWKIWCLTGALAILLLLAGCGPKTGQQVAGSYVVTDIQGTQVRIPHKPQRILTLSMSTDEVVLGLVKPERMAGVNAMLDDPVSSNVVELGRQVATKVRNPSVEEIAAMQPDLVIVPDWGDISRVQSLRDLGIPVVVCKGAKNLQEIQETVELIAAAVGEPQRGTILLQKMDEKLAWIEQRLPQLPEQQRPSVVLISLMKTYGGRGCSFDEACHYAGVVNGMAAAGIEDGQAMSKEKLVAINPDVLFLPTYNDHGQYDIGKFRTEYLSDPSLQGLKAVQQGNLREPFEGYIYNCSQDFVLGVQEIAYRVYGDAFAQGTQEHLSAVDE